MNVDDCFKQGLLKKEQPDMNKMQESLNVAKHFIERADGNYNIGFYDIALICAYNSMLQSARAVLFKDGIKERSHACVVLYLKEYYVKKGLIPAGIINILDITRKSRHKTQYDGRIMVTSAEAREAIKDAVEFLDVVTKLLSK